MKLFSSLGFALAAYHIGYKISYPLIRHHYTARLNLVERYGPKSWAVVTGGTDGIGKQLSRSLAKTGFNICLIARNKEKAENTITQLKKQAPQSSFDFVVADLNTTDISVFKDIEKQVGARDVSILINNVGLLARGKFHNEKDDYLKTLLVTNTFPQTFLTTNFLDRLANRQKKSAIINLSSIAGDRYDPYLAIYGATKTYNDRLSNAINYQEQNIDLLSVRPCVTTSKMNLNAKGFFVVSPHQCAEGVLNDLGKSNISYGHWRHWLQGGLVGMLPQFAYNYISANRNQKHEGFKTQ